MKKLFGLFILLTLVGCSTKYQPKTFFSCSGYKDTQLSPSTYIITFDGVTYGDSQTVYKYCMIRAAEITKENNCKYFVILSSQGVNNVSYSYNEFGVSSSSYPSVHMTIKVYKERPSVEVFYDADDFSIPVSKESVSSDPKKPVSYRKPRKA